MKPEMNHVLTRSINNRIITFIATILLLAGLVACQNGQGTQSAQIDAAALLAESKALQEQHPQRSVLLILEALEAAEQAGETTAPAVQALRDGLAFLENRILTGHTGEVYTVAFSHDSRWLITTGADGPARLWDLQAGDPSAGHFQIGARNAPIWETAFGLNNHWVATASDDNVARLWNLEADDPMAEPVVLTGHLGFVVDIAFSPDGRWVATGSRDETARLWPLDSDNIVDDAIELAGHDNRVNIVAFSPDGDWLVTASPDGSVRIWNMSLADPTSEMAILAQHEDIVTDVAFSLDGRWLATASADNTIRLWNMDADDPTVEPIILADGESNMNAVVFSADGRWLAAADVSNIWLWSLESGRPVSSPAVIESQQVAFSPDGRWLATASPDGTASLWALSEGALAAEPIVLAGHTGRVRDITFSPDGHWLATASADGTVRLWLALTPDELKEVACETASRNLTQREWVDYFGDAPYHQTCKQWPVGE